MYEGSEPDLQRIIGLTAKCPEDLRAKAFEILLQGYVDSLLGAKPSKSEMTPLGQQQPLASQPQREPLDVTIPAEVQTRLQAIAKRKKVGTARLAELFDFSTDPFVFAPIHVPGSANADRTRKVALLVAARSFLASARWVADWAEIKAMCTHQACYDLPNFSRVLNRAHGTIFRTVNGGVSVELSAQGVTEAEDLLVSLAGGANAAEE